MNGEVITHSHFWLDCPIQQAKPPQWSAQQWSSSRANKAPRMPVQLKAAWRQVQIPRKASEDTISAHANDSVNRRKHGRPLKCCKLFLSTFYLIIFPTHPNFWMQSRSQVYQAETGVVKVYEEGWVCASGGRWGPSSFPQQPLFVTALNRRVSCSPVWLLSCYVTSLPNQAMNAFLIPR